MLDIRPMLEFLDFVCLENSLFFVIPDAYGRNTYECHWERKNDLKPWRVRMTGHQNWHHHSTAEFIQFCQTDQLDMAAMTRELAGSLLSQAVFARTFSRGVEELFGKDRVDEAEKQTQTFVEQLKKMAASSVMESRQLLDDVQSQAQAKPKQRDSQRGGLKLVRPSDAN